MFINITTVIHIIIINKVMVWYHQNLKGKDKGKGKGKKVFIIFCICY